MRKVGKDASEVANCGSLEMYVRDCKDELSGEYQKAQAEWEKIEASFLKWVGTGAVATATGLASGHLIPNIASLSVGVLNTMLQLGLRHSERKQFRQTNPISIVVDLSNRNTPGRVTLV